jgi:osmotically-inducible protein OsmY
MTRSQTIGGAGLWLALSAVALASPATTSAGEPCTKAAVHAEQSADRRATDEIKRRIEAEETVSPLARTITVTTDDGIVTLRGVVIDDEDRLVLASLAESAPGVRRVEDRLELRR